MYFHRRRLLLHAGALGRNRERVLFNEIERPRSITLAIHLSAVALVLLCSACSMFGNSHKDAMSDLKWDFANDAVSLDIHAEADLNRVEGQAHTLVLGIYEASEATSFRKLAAAPEALLQSMATGSVGTGFTQVARYVVAPGQHSLLILDRAQNTRFVGIVAAYATGAETVPTRLYEVPVDVSKNGWVRTTYTAAPGLLSVKLRLGAEGILDAQLGKPPTAAQIQAATPLAGGGKVLRLDTQPQPPGCTDCSAADDTSIHKL